VIVARAPRTVVGAVRHRRLARFHRAFNRALGRCVNDSYSGTHGPPVDGTTRCAPCLDVYRKTHRSKTRRKDG